MWINIFPVGASLRSLQFNKQDEFSGVSNAIKVKAVEAMGKPAETPCKVIPGFWIFGESEYTKLAYLQATLVLKTSLCSSSAWVVHNNTLISGS